MIARGMNATYGEDGRASSSEDEHLKKSDKKDVWWFMMVDMEEVSCIEELLTIDYI